MRKIGLMVVSLMLGAFCLMGCSDNDKETISAEDSCARAYDRITNSSGLTQEQIRIGKEPYVSACADYYNNMPVCRSEAAANLACAADITESEYGDLWDAVIPCEDEFDVELAHAHDNDDFLACIKKIKTKCFKEFTTWVLCGTTEQNRNELQSYVNTEHKDPGKALAEALDMDYLDLLQLLSDSKAYEGVFWDI